MEGEFLRLPPRLQLGWCNKFEGPSESKELFAIKINLLIIGKKQNMKILSPHLHLLLHIVILDIEAIVVP